MKTNIHITAEEGARLRNLAERQAAIQGWIKSVQALGEDRIRELSREGQAVWQDLASKYGLDLSHMHYQPSADFTKVVLVAAQFEGE